MRILLGTAAGLLLLTVLVSLWPVSDAAQTRKYTHKISVTFLGRTNASAPRVDGLIRIKNLDSEVVWIRGYLEIHYFKETRCDLIELVMMDMSPGSTRDIAFPSPTNDVCWRAEVGCVGQREINRKVYWKNHLPAWHFLWRWTAEYFALRPRFAYTDWIGSTNRQTGATLTNW
jgi:hypothetical protein